MKHPRCVVISAAIGSGYVQAMKRMEKSLRFTGWLYDMLFFGEENMSGFYIPGSVYTCKASALNSAIKQGYDCIMWLDSVIWAVNDPNEVMQIVINEGQYFIQSGYNLAQTAADSDLVFAGMTRDEAERLPELASGCFGIDMRTDRGKKFAEIFLAAAKAGVFSTSRLHDNQSSDPRFLFSRQDQTAATIAYHQSGYDKMYNLGQHLCYFTDKKKRKGINFVMRGV